MPSLAPVSAVCRWIAYAWASEMPWENASSAAPDRSPPQRSSRHQDQARTNATRWSRHRLARSGRAPLRASLADVAPSAGNVGPDLDLHQAAVRLRSQIAALFRLGGSRRIAIMSAARETALPTVTATDQRGPRPFHIMASAPMITNTYVYNIVTVSQAVLRCGDQRWMRSSESGGRIGENPLCGLLHGSEARCA